MFLEQTCYITFEQNSSQPELLLDSQSYIIYEQNYRKWRFGFLILCESDEAFFHSLQQRNEMVFVS